MVALKRVFGVVIALFLLLFLMMPGFSAYQTTSYQMSGDHLSLFCDRGAVYLLSYNGGNCHIEKLCPTVGSYDLHLRSGIVKAGVFGDQVVALCNDLNNDQTVVYLYHPDTDALDSFAIRHFRYEGDRGFCFSNDCIYLVPDHNNNIVECYSVSGSLLKRHSFNSTVTQVGADYRGNVFAVSAKQIYRLNNDRFTALSGNDVTVPVTYFDNDLASDATGRIFRISGGSCKLLFKTDAAYGACHPAHIDGTVYYPDHSMIYGYRLSSGEKIGEAAMDVPVNDLYADRGYIYAVSNSGKPTVARIRTTEFTDLTTRYTPTNPQAANDDRSPTEVQSETLNADKERIISSTAYQIDFRHYRISGIPAGTTFAQLKNHIRHDGYEMRLYRESKQIKSGKCGTAMAVVFDSDQAEYTFELAVVGDITGEGNVNSRDLSLLMEYLIGTADFNGVYQLSADLSADGIVDVKDLSLMHKMI